MERVWKSTVFLLCVCSAASGFCEEWAQEKSDHFIVYSQGTDSAFSRRVLYAAEKDYTRIARYLGYARYSNFWTWEDRVKIFIYPSKAMYLKESLMPEWSQGMAEYSEKKIASFAGSQEFIEAILPHEIAHLSFRDFVGFAGEVPVWLDEGVAQSAVAGGQKNSNALLVKLVEEGRIIALGDMMEIDIRLIRASDTLKLSPFLSSRQNQEPLHIRGEEFVQLYYTQAASIVDFLITRFGTDRFSQFCRALRDGARLNEALATAYAPHVGSIVELQEQWLSYIRKYR